MKMNLSKWFLVLAAALMAALFGWWKLSRQNASQVPNASGAGHADASPSDPARSEPVDIALQTSASRLIDKSLDERGRPPELNEMRERWKDHSNAEIEEIARESFAESLECSLDMKKTIFHIIGYRAGGDHPAGPAVMYKLALTRRFAKMLEELQSGGPSVDQVNYLTSTLQMDARRMRILLTQHVSDNDIVTPGVVTGPGWTENHEDLVNYPIPVAFRMVMAEMLAAQIIIPEALPSILESLDARLGTTVANWSASAFAADRILSNIDPAKVTKDQRAIIQEYLAWKRSLSPDEERVFHYEKMVLPSWRSNLRPAERSTVMGLPLDSSEGTFEIVLPPLLESSDNLSRNTFDPIPALVVVCDFAKRFVESGGTRVGQTGKSFKERIEEDTRKREERYFTIEEIRRMRPDMEFVFSGQG